MKKLRLIFFSMICFWMLGFASAKADDDYEITKYEVNVDILDNGDARVRQDVAYDFDGDFHGVYYKPGHEGNQRHSGRFCTSDSKRQDD